MGRHRASVLRLSPVAQAVARDQTSPHSAAGRADDVAWVGVWGLPARSKKTSWSRWASADPPPGNRPPPLSLPFLLAVLGYTPSPHPIPLASAASRSRLMGPQPRFRCSRARPPLAGTPLVACRAHWSRDESL